MSYFDYKHVDMFDMLQKPITTMQHQVKLKLASTKVDNW